MNDVTPSGPPLEGDQPEVAPTADELAAENAELRAQVGTLAKKRRTKDRVRGLVAGFLVVVFAITFLSGGVGFWLHRNTLNKDVWAERVIPLGQDPRVQQALATWTTDQLMTTVDPKALIADALPPKAQILAGPISSAVEDFVRQKVEEFYASPRFEKLWAFAVTQAHDQAVNTLRGKQEAVTADGDQITINLVPLFDAVLNDVLKEAPGLVGSDVKLPTVSVNDLPDSARKKLGDALGQNLSDDFGVIKINDGGALHSSQEAVKIIDRAVALAIFLSLAAFIGALAVSTRRRRTLLQLVGAAALMCIIVRRAGFGVQSQVNNLVKVAVNQPAAKVVVATFVDPLTHSAGVVLWVLALIALIAVVTGSYPWVVRLRHGAVELVRSITTTVTDRATDDATVAWIQEHADALRIAGYVLGGLALWFVDLSWLSFIVIAALVAIWQVVLARVAPDPGVDDADQVEGDGDGGDPAADASVPVGAAPPSAEEADGGPDPVDQG